MVERNTPSKKVIRYHCKYELPIRCISYSFIYFETFQMKSNHE